MKETKSERLARELADERQYAGDLLHELGKGDATLRMLARAVVAHDAQEALWMARDILSPGQRQEVQAIQTREGVRFTGWPVLLLVGAMVEHLDSIDAPNYCTFNVTVPPRDGAGEPRKLSLTAQWEGGKTPADMIGELMAERDDLRRQLAEARAPKAGA